MNKLEFYKKKLDFDKKKCNILRNFLKNMLFILDTINVDVRIVRDCGKV